MSFVEIPFYLLSLICYLSSILYSASALSTIWLIYKKRHATCPSVEIDNVDIEAVGAEEKDVGKAVEDLIQL